MKNDQINSRQFYPRPYPHIPYPSSPSLSHSLSLFFLFFVKQRTFGLPHENGRKQILDLLSSRSRIPFSTPFSFQFRSNGVFQVGSILEGWSKATGVRRSQCKYVIKRERNKGSSWKDGGRNRRVLLKKMAEE